MREEPIDKKIAVMGNSAVGKTSLVIKYLGRSFKEQYIPTLGANFSTKFYEKDGQKFRVMIIDMGGQKNFEQLRERYFIGTSGVFLVFDVTRPFDADNLIIPWVKEILEFTNQTGVPLAILANKVDLDLLRQASPTQGLNATTQVKSNFPDTPVQYFETSAIDGTGVQEAFNWLINQIIEEI